MDNHPNDTQNDFRVTLSTPLDLRNEWEVGLASYIFPHSWHNKVLEGHKELFLIKINVDGDGGNDYNKMEYWRDIHIQVGNYKTRHDLIDSIKISIENNHAKFLKFSYDESFSGLKDPEFLRINVY